MTPAPTSTRPIDGGSTSCRSARFVALVGEDPRSLSRPRDHAAADVGESRIRSMAHSSWICVVNPGERTSATLLRLLQDAHEAARLRYQRRAATEAVTGLSAAGSRGYSSELMKRPARSAAAARSSLSTSRVSSSRENLPTYPISARAATVSAKSTRPLPMLWWM